MSTTMSRETRAEVICNLAGDDSNNEAAWQAALVEADQQIADGFDYLKEGDFSYLDAPKVSA